MTSELAAREAFNHYDMNKNGTIEAIELKEALAELGKILSEKEINEMINGADINKDGAINFEEFYAMLQKLKD